MNEVELQLRKLKPVHEYRGVEFIFTDEPGEIKKFMRLYADLYRHDPKFIGFRDFCDDVMENYIGEGQYTQLLMKDGHCIGGGRISHHPKNRNFLLPMELDLSDGPDDTRYLLKNMMPKLDIEGGCTEVSRVVLAPEYRGDGNFSGSMFLNFCIRWLDLEGQYLFVLTDRVRSRLYRQLVKQFTQLDGHVFKHLPYLHRIYFEGADMQIVGWDKYNQLRDVYASTEK